MDAVSCLAWRHSAFKLFRSHHKVTFFVILALTFEKKKTLKNLASHFLSTMDDIVSVILFFFGDTSNICVANITPILGFTRGEQYGGHWQYHCRTLKHGYELLKCFEDDHPHIQSRHICTSLPWNLFPNDRCQRLATGFCSHSWVLCWVHKTNKGEDRSSLTFCSSLPLTVCLPASLLLDLKRRGGMFYCWLMVMTCFHPFWFSLQMNTWAWHPPAYK